MAEHPTVQTDILPEATSVLLDCRADLDRLQRAAGRLHELFASNTGIRGDRIDKAKTVDTRLSDGLAIAPAYAAECLLDPVRTARFLQGVQAGIEELRRRFPRQRIEILYAGCGPYAPLALPLTTRFSAEQIRFTLLDIHEESLEAAQQLIDVFGLADYIGACICCDATTYRQPADKPLHMVVSETMLKALSREPQVAITRNLVPQLVDGGVLVPEEIAVDAVLDRAPGDATDGKQDNRAPLGRVFALNVETARTQEAGDTKTIPAATLAIPSDLEEASRLLLLTTITTFDGIVIGEGECGLTEAYSLAGIDPKDGGRQIRFEYVLGARPRFRHVVE